MRSKKNLCYTRSREVKCIMNNPFENVTILDFTHVYSGV